MSIDVLPGNVRFEAARPVEIPVSVDGKTLRVAIEWSAFTRMLPTTDKSFDAVAKALRGGRETIEMAIRAYVFAQGRAPRSMRTISGLRRQRAHWKPVWSR